MSKIATKNPWRCPQCTKRFPTKEKLHEHFADRDLCGTYAQQGLEAVQAMVYGNSTAYAKWRVSKPIDLFDEALK